MAEGYSASLAYKNNSVAFTVIPTHVATRIVRHSHSVKMFAIQVTILLQMMCRLLVASPVGENVTLPLNWNATLLKNETLPVNREPEVVKATDQPALPSGYVAFPELGFAYKLTETALPQFFAKPVCLRDNGQLAVIDTTEKAEKILNHFNGGQWVGVILSSDGHWVDIDEKSTRNLPWARNYPFGSWYHCVYLSESGRGLKNDSCSTARSYLCEIPLPRN